jgi:ferric-dicitrate binding protein FerR (iron transport regulator)
MTDFNRFKKIAVLIAGKLGGTLTPDDEKELDAWLEEEPDNKNLYRQIKDSSNFKRWRLSVENSDREMGWEKLYSSIRAQERQAIRLNILKYAAAIILPLMVAGGIYFYILPENNRQQIAQAQIKPGSSRAVLTLDDGRAVVLDNPEELAIEEKDGTTIQKSEGRLDYSKPVEKKSEELLFNTINIPRGGEYILVLSDGTKVYFNSMSNFRYPVQFTGNKREVELTGEAYFEVARSSEMTFVVKTGWVNIEVMATKFNVKAYENSGSIVATLVEGQVKIEAINNPAGSRILKPDEQAVFDVIKNSIDVNRVDVSLFTAWKYGEFVFYNQRLEDIMETLTRWYSAKVFYMNPSVKELRFSGSLSRYGEIGPILDIIRSTGKVEVEINQNSIIFREKS